jgi:hypothetical protein
VENSNPLGYPHERLSTAVRILKGFFGAKWKEGKYEENKHRDAFEKSTA